MFVLLDGRTGIVLVAPDDVPESANGHGTGKDDGSKVDEGDVGDGVVRGHAEEGEGEEGPGCQKVSRIRNNVWMVARQAGWITYRQQRHWRRNQTCRG